MGKDIAKLKLVGNEEGQQAPHRAQKAQRAAEEDHRGRFAKGRTLCLSEPKHNTQNKQSETEINE